VNELKVTTRPTIQDGIVVEYTAPGIDVSASRNAVMVHCGVMRDDERVNLFRRALRLAVEQFRHLQRGHREPLEHGQAGKDGDA